MPREAVGGGGRGRMGALSNHLLAPATGPAHGGPATLRAALRATSGPQVPSAGRSTGRQDWTNLSSQLHRVACGRSRCLASCPPAQLPPGGVPPAPDASLLLGNGLKGPAGMHPRSFSHSPTPDGPPWQGAETAPQGAPMGSAGPLRCPPSPRAAGRALLEATPLRLGQDRGSRGGPATPTLPRAGPHSTQHGVPSARLPGPRAHGSFHGWRSGLWGWALPRGWRASGYRTWQGQGPARPLSRAPGLSKQSQGPAPTRRPRAELGQQAGFASCYFIHRPRPCTDPQGSRHPHPLAREIAPTAAGPPRAGPYPPSQPVLTPRWLPPQDAHPAQPGTKYRT